MQKQLPQIKFQNIQTIYRLERYNHLSDYDPHERVRNLKYGLLPYFQLAIFQVNRHKMYLKYQLAHPYHRLSF